MAPLPPAVGGLDDIIRLCGIMGIFYIEYSILTFKFLTNPYNFTSIKKMLLKKYFKYNIISNQCWLKYHLNYSVKYFLIGLGIWEFTFLFISTTDYIN